MSAPTPPRPRIAVLPLDGGPWVETARAAVEKGGATVLDPDAIEKDESGGPDALVWTAAGLDPVKTATALKEALRRYPGVRWIQLPWAGVEQYAEAGLLDHEHVWTCAKGAYSEPVAEHALALTLACLRSFKAYSRAEHWTGQAGRTLVDARVTIFGGGGIALELIRLLEPFRCLVTVVRKRPDPIEGVRVIAWERREEALPRADAVILALALTDENIGFFDYRHLAAMESHACLVNIARGRHVVTADLVAALTNGQIGSAGLDVTEPEPLPDGHPLWLLDNCLITPHTANTTEMAIPVLSARITANVRHFARGEPLDGVVNPDLGY